MVLPSFACLQAWRIRRRSATCLFLKVKTIELPLQYNIITYSILVTQTNFPCIRLFALQAAQLSLIITAYHTLCCENYLINCTAQLPLLAAAYRSPHYENLLKNMTTIYLFAAVCGDLSFAHAVKNYFAARKITRQCEKLLIYVMTRLSLIAAVCGGLSPPALRKIT